jgi:hypothetical protein
MVFMRLFYYLAKLYSGWQYRLYSFKEVADDLGVDVPGNIAFEGFVKALTTQYGHSAKLTKFMPRDDAEKVFASAIKKERFSRHSLYSYYFDKDWVGFYLQFDQNSKLRRLYIQHKNFKKHSGEEIELNRPKIYYHQYV